MNSLPLYIERLDAAALGSVTQFGKVPRPYCTWIAVKEPSPFVSTSVDP